MTRLKQLMASAFLWNSLVIGAAAADVKVIANPSVGASVISTEELKGIFLVTRTSLSDGSHVEPVLLKAGAVHQSFLKRYIGRSENALETYYRSLVFTGRGLMPRTVSSDDDVVQYVARTKGAVGYVNATAAGAGVKTIEVK